MEVPVWLSDEKATTEESRIHRIVHNIIDQARIRPLTQELSDVQMKIKGRREYNVKELIKPPPLARMRAGQQLTAFIKVALVPTQNQSPGKEEESDVLYEQLMQMLGEAETELLVIEVSFKHSLFPSQTRLTTKMSHYIRRVDKLSGWTGPSITCQNEYEIEHNKALFVARTWPPDAALKRLQRKFKSEYFAPDHKSRLYLIREELEFQNTRHELHKARVESPAMQQTAHTGKDAGNQQLPRDKRATLHVPDSTGQAHAEARSTPTSAAPNDTLATPQTRDAARQIWQHMRRDSRSASLPTSDLQLQARVSNESLDRLEAEDATLREIRRQALQNKRSVGADTLRDFQSEGVGGGVGMGIGRRFGSLSSGGADLARERTWLRREREVSMPWL